ncbi:MAG: hypothetical protein ABIH23_01420 [bacterium]
MVRIRNQHNRLTSVALGLLFFAVYPAQAEKKTDVEAAGLFGPVKTVRTEKAVFYEAFSKWQESQRIISDVTEYNEKGFMTARFDYTPGGEPDSRRTYSYDESGNMTEEAECDAGGSLKWRTVYTFDDRGYATSSIRYDGDGVVNERSVYVHDKNGSVTAYRIYDAEGSLKSERTYANDDDGRVVGSSWYSLLEPVGETATYERDDEGRVITHTRYGLDGKIKREFTYTYDDTENTKVTGEYGPDGPLIRETSPTYNTEDQDADRVVFRAAISSATSENDPGCPEDVNPRNELSSFSVKQIQKLSFSNRLRHRPETCEEYEHDAQGNWIKKKTLKWYEPRGHGARPYYAPSTVEYRTITYYPQ